MFNKKIMKRTHLVAPSLLSADFLHLVDELEMLNKSKADWIHLDIMDGNFVPNITFGFDIIKQINKVAKKDLDVHLMIEKPELYIERFANSGADILTVHYEANNHLHRLVMQIKDVGCKAGVAINPHTPVTVLEEIVRFVDMVLVMSVNPGFGGQKFIPNAIDKIKRLDEMKKLYGYDFLIEVDGGVNFETGKALLEAGANVLVAGSFVFNNEAPEQVIARLKEL